MIVDSSGDEEMLRNRRSPAGREAHREQERRRRGRQREAPRLSRDTTDADSVGDQTFVDFGIAILNEPDGGAG